MLPFRADLARTLRARLDESLCLAHARGPLKDQALARGNSKRSNWSGRLPAKAPERGSAVVEFTFLALLLMVPVVYFIITVGQIQGASFAVVGAADQAAKVYVAQADPSTAQAAAEQAVALALADFGHPVERASVAMACNQPDCQAAGAAVTVTVRLGVALPFVPFADVLSATEVEASATQLVGRYR